MKWTNRIDRTHFYKWIAVLLSVLLVDEAVNSAGFIGMAPFTWYFSTLISMLVTGLFLAAGIHLFKLKGNRNLTIACFLMVVIFLLGSIYGLITLMQINLNSNYYFK
jgi:hypothetical protein